jgi:hypothetical protein
VSALVLDQDGRVSIGLQFAISLLHTAVVAMSVSMDGVISLLMAEIFDF